MEIDVAADILQGIRDFYSAVEDVFDTVGHFPYNPIATDAMHKMLIELIRIAAQDDESPKGLMDDLKESLATTAAFMRVRRIVNDWLIVRSEAVLKRSDITDEYRTELQKKLDRFRFTASQKVTLVDEEIT